MKTKQQLEEQIKALQAELEALPEHELKKGDLCEFWDDGQPQDASSHISYFKEYLTSAVCDVDDITYDHARRIETKATRIPWAGGDCPVDTDDIVAFEFRNGYLSTNKASFLNWSHDEHHMDIVAYWRLEG